MARIRSIKPSFFSSDDTCARSPLARLLFLGLGTEADRRGRVEDKPSQLKRRLLPDDACDVDALLWELAAAKLIRRYQAGEVRVIQILNFAKHQKPHPKEPESVLPADGIERKPCKDTASREQASEHPVETPSTPARNGSGDLNNGYGDLGSGGGSHAPLAQTGPLIVSPAEFHKRHGKHVLEFCDFVCLPTTVFDEFVTRVVAAGADEGTARVEVLRWATSVRQAWRDSGRIAGADIFKFWANEWEQTHGSNKPAAGAIDVLAGLR